MEIPNALLENWPGEFSRTVEMMTGSTVQVRFEPGPPCATLWWVNQFSSKPLSRVFVGAGREGWFGIGSAVLQAAGVESSEEAEIRSTWIELVEQAASAVAGSASTPANRVESTAGSETGPPEAQRKTVTVEIEGRKFSLELAVAVEHVVEEPPARSMAASAGAGSGTPGRSSPSSEQPGLQLSPASQRTMEALLDIHLPVSISFGHARIPLKDVLKLTAGTVVELNRQPEDPVDIIVNDCVIARGEVVVMDGNYAVRIQSIVGRQERLGIGAAVQDRTRNSL